MTAWTPPRTASTSWCTPSSRSTGKGRRLPITDTTAELIRGQQQAVRALFPDTPVGELVLLPGKQRNPRGTRSLTLSTLSTVHRGWVDGLPPLLLADGTEFDKAARGPVRLPAQLRAAPR